MKKNDGGYVFPQDVMDFAVPINEPKTKIPIGRYREGGMSLRDYFAAQAIATFDLLPSTKSADESGKVARSCYEVADAMLKERGRGRGREHDPIREGTSVSCGRCYDLGREDERKAMMEKEVE